MYIRPLTRDDLPQVAAITNQTFKYDELFAWLYPNQDRYPDDIRRFQIIRLRTRLVEVGSHGFVVVTEESDTNWNGQPEVVGYAFFVRSGDDEAARKWKQDSLFRKFERHLLSWEMFYERKVLDRAADNKRIAQYMATSHYDFYSILEPRWHLGILGVSPKHQRRGIGGMLVRHGQKLAGQEGLPMTLEASIVGKRLYSRLGFEIVDETELVEGLSRIAMVWEPQGLEGLWLENIERDKAEVKGRK